MSDQSFDDQLRVISLPKLLAYDLVFGELKTFLLSKSLPGGYLKRHSHVAVCNKWRKGKPLPEVYKSKFDKLYVLEEGIIGMAEILKCVQTYPGDASFRYWIGRTNLVTPIFLYKQVASSVCLPLDVRDRFLEHTGYEVW
jgi:hypothetical protein